MARLGRHHRMLWRGVADRTKHPDGQPGGDSSTWDGAQADAGAGSACSTAELAAGRAVAHARSAVAAAPAVLLRAGRRAVPGGGVWASQPAARKRDRRTCRGRRRGARCDEEVLPPVLRLTARFVLPPPSSRPAERGRDAEEHTLLRSSSLMTLCKMSDMEARTHSLGARTHTATQPRAARHEGTRPPARTRTGGARAERERARTHGRIRTHKHADPGDDSAAADAAPHTHTRTASEEKKEREQNEKLKASSIKQARESGTS